MKSSIRSDTKRYIDERESYIIDDNDCEDDDTAKTSGPVHLIYLCNVSVSMSQISM